MAILYKKIAIKKKPIINGFDNPIYQKTTEGVVEGEEAILNE